MSFRAQLWLTTALLTASFTATAVAAEWRVVDVDGLAVSLVEGKWREIARGDLLTDPVMRTLRRARVTLGLGDTTVVFGPDAAASLGQPSSAALTITQYAGSMTAEFHGISAAGITIAAGRLTITNVSGAIVVAMNDAAAAAVLQTGVASVRLDDGTAVRLKGGEMASTGSGALVVQPVDLTTSLEAATQLAETAIESSSKTNDGNASAGGNGGNGNGGGNAGGGGNPGGNGNGNPGGGNGNGGNSGNGNGNGNKAPK